jgi:hypothetical protein
MIKLGTKELPNLSSELTVKEFAKLNEILAQQIEPIEKWYQIFESLGAIETEIDELDFNEFKALIKEFNSAESKDTEIVQFIEVDGFTYKAYDTEFKISIKDLKKIEKSVAEKPYVYIADMLAVVYKRTDLSNAEHYDSAHIKHKAKLFSELKANIALPIVWHVAKKLTETVDNVEDDSVE